MNYPIDKFEEIKLKAQFEQSIGLQSFLIV